MKIKISEIVQRPDFQYLFGSYTIDINEIELALLDMPSSISREEALLKWQEQGPRDLK